MFQIRRAENADAAGVIAAHRKSIRELCAKDYTQAQIDAWAGRNFREDRWVDTFSKDHVWVIAGSNDLANASHQTDSASATHSICSIYGFGHLRFHSDSDAEVMGLYFVPEVTGLGFGKKLIQIMKDDCRSQSIQSLHLLSTRTARTFYENEGFLQFGDEKKIAMGDQFVECFQMQINLR